MNNAVSECTGKLWSQSGDFGLEKSKRYKLKLKKKKKKKLKRSST